MAIDSIPYPDSEDLASKEKVFYPLRIPVSHWQLRHYISHPEPDHLYYASGHDVHCLYTSSKKRKHIATLPFEARCTSSGYGWVCVGGEDEGHFAAIKIDGSAPRSSEVDERLDVGALASGSADPGARRAASVKVERIGEEIVNSISIHRIQDEEAHLDDIVAVLTNNDKTVRVYSLPQNLETSVLDLPFAMNHATVSPDGTMLVAVGDVNQAYFFQREIRGTPPQIPKPHNRLSSASIDWRLSNVVNLHVSGPEASMGYFTTAWSPNGQLVAVGSEGGYITVLDVDLLNDTQLDDEEAIVAVVPSSRPDVPQPHPGAIRTMIFSPDPWDLLIWAEDQGRICIADLRTGLKRKQVITLDPKEAGLKRVEFEDLAQDGPILPEELGTRDLNQLELDFVRQYRHAQDNATAVNFATEYIEARRRQRQHRQDMASLRAQHGSSTRTGLEDDQQGLTAREQEILDALRTTRHREEARSQGGVPRGVNYTTPDMFAAGARSSASASPGSTDSSPSAQHINDILNSAEDTFPELARTSGSSAATASSSSQLPIIRLPGDTGTWDSNPSRNTSSGTAPSRLPRRRASVILSPPSNTTSPPTTSRATQASQPTETTSNSDDDNPWRTIEDAMTLERGPLFESANRTSSASPAHQNPTTTTQPTPAELASELSAERAERAARARSLARQRERWRALVSDGSQPPNAGAATGANTTALPTTDLRRLGGYPDSRLAGFPDGYESVLRRINVGRGNGITGREVGVRTAGLAMSEDGSTLWIASEEGIFEVRIGRKKRLFWPAVQLL